jgi:CRP/FNR family transcriptional regulator, anaerobic regulatory protein
MRSEGGNKGDWIEHFEGLAALEPDVRGYLTARSVTRLMRKGTVVFGPGKSPDNLLLLTQGSVRVQQVSEGGREIVLYRVQAGQSCVLTTACLLAFENYAAEGIAETDIVAVTIPRPVFDDLLARSKGFRDFVFATYSRRITDLFLVIEEVAFQRVDIRLAQKLLELSDAGGLVKTTHQKLAAELGTAREVVSRQLQEFLRRGWISQSRGAVRLLDRGELKALGGTQV